MFKSIYPFNGETVAEYQPYSPAQVEARLARAAQAYTALRQTTLEQRCNWMRATAQHLKDKATEYGTLITREMGKTLKEAKAEVNKCADSALSYADHAAEMLDEFLLVMHVGLDHVHRGQQDQFLGHFATMRKHANLEATRGELADELGTDKTGAAEDADALNLHIVARLCI